MGGVHCGRGRIVISVTIFFVCIGLYTELTNIKQYSNV